MKAVRWSQFLKHTTEDRVGVYVSLNFGGERWFNDSVCLSDEAMVKAALATKRTTWDERDIEAFLKAEFPNAKIERVVPPPPEATKETT